jgi:hypothetical protein
MRLSTLILPMICGLVWGWAAWIGLRLEMGVQTRIGSVGLGQVVYSVVYPLTALTASLVPSALLSQTRFAWAGNLWSLIFILLVFPYLVILDVGM